MGSALVALIVTGCSALPVIGNRAPAEQWAFTAPWDERSALSVRSHATALDAVIVDWIALDPLSGQPTAPFGDSIARTLGPGVRRMTLLTSYSGEEFNAALIRRLAVDSTLLKQTATGIVDLLEQRGSRGVVIDFEGMTSRDTLLTRAVVGTIATRIRDRGLGPVVVALPAGDTTAYPARLFDTADLLLVMLYDQHWSTSPAGPIASPEWVRRALAMRVAESGPSRIVAGLPLYGYQWKRNVPAVAISFEDARHLAAEAGVALERDPASQSLRALRTGPDPWELWVTDAEQLNALRREVASLRVNRIAYWRLGMEDPSMW